MLAARVALLLLQAIVGAGILYHYLLLVAGGKAWRRTQAGTEPQHDRCFAVAIPAHNEGSIIRARAAGLCALDYPPDRFDVHVAADYCTDETASEARLGGAIVHERSTGPRGRKGYALARLLGRLLRDQTHYDAVVVFDADSQPAPGFLRRMNEALEAEAQVLQGRHEIANTGASVFAALADGDMRLNNRIRNQAKETLGLSARLMGDAMCFRREVLEQYPYHMDSLVEDREYGLHLVAQGVRVRYLPGAVSRGQAAACWADATGQRLRWYGGVFELQRRYLRPLLRAAWKSRSVGALDLALELALPSFSTMALLAPCLLVLHWSLGVARAPVAFVTAAVLAALVCVYPFLGLLVERAPWHCYRALLFGPAYVAWRVWVGLLARLRPGQVRWVRTPRAEEEQ
jgi:cellulose synthase/poly-beta-1,6-N-acetylglucosamine synthase-like glycosyltransferase